MLDAYAYIKCSSFVGILRCINVSAISEMEISKLIIFSWHTRRYFLQQYLALLRLLRDDHFLLRQLRVQIFQLYVRFFNLRQAANKPFAL